MKNTYSQLSSEERDQIAILRAQGNSLSDIAKIIGRNKSTVCRELNRNQTPTYNVYLPHKAHERAKQRKQQAAERPRLKNQTIRAYIMTKLTCSLKRSGKRAGGLFCYAVLKTDAY